MKFFKKSSKALVILTILLSIPAVSYAIVDASVFGGYSFAGKYEASGSSSDTKGYQYGAYAHLNTGIPALFTVGLGGFYLIAPMTLETTSGDIDATKKTVGIDVYAQIDLPVLPIFPYVRYGHAINEKLEVKNSGGTTTYSKNFNSNYYGIGICKTLINAVKLDLQLFVEYLRTSSKQEKDVKTTGNVINVGIKASL